LWNVFKWTNMRRPLSRPLSDLGFRRGRVYETIVTTAGFKDRPNAAPLGVTVSSSRGMILRPFAGTETLDNLRTARCGVVNVTSDPWRFYKTALKREPWVGPPPSSWFEPARKINAPRLKGSDSYVEFVVSNISTKGLRRLVRCRAVHVEFAGRKNAPYCRSSYAAIESVIHATRVKEFLGKRNLHDAKRLIDLVGHYSELASKIAPESADVKIIRSILAHYGPAST